MNHFTLFHVALRRVGIVAGRRLFAVPGILVVKRFRPAVRAA
ncbi:MAG: hypothetical protein PSW75_05950 [bacterium]|nr:hypothetical protein [bacterium]MDI1335271.1 hypothetical protein [Lacunisphaera sp.]